MASIGNSTGNSELARMLQTVEGKSIFHAVEVLLQSSMTRNPMNHVIQRQEGEDVFVAVLVVVAEHRS